ncbi:MULTISPECIES: amino acid ABC transporter permease [Bartonella]|uniref:General L-amino acid ABC transporter membrane protein n=1 Tax=Bartonella choladocola TaxID=2750995 RepID=A0A1U9MHW2_9HYPH|nr:MULTISPECIES: ABC transporter permease subunit [Bartonella]AQT47313.1 general L-amino acid ABC transporter membrane protein [Bartonella choladocola]MBH9975478.1 ABC transporter permease subunit [Bartonella choladocola]MBI0015085.1 ABC transporter permease subunit [Bartonella sp. B10834G3]
MMSGRSLKVELGAFLNVRSLSSFAVQCLVIIALFLVIRWITHNTIVNLRASNIASGFDFLDKRAGFNQPSSIIQYDDNATNGEVIEASLVNLVFISAISLITATFIGLFIGIGRLSNNWLIAKLSLCYVEFFRNIPPLVLLFFWSIGVMQILPPARQSLHWGAIAINIRGIYLPRPVWGEHTGLFIVISILLIAVAVGLHFRARYMIKERGLTSIRWWYGFVIGVLCPVILFFLLAYPTSWDIPALKGFNYSGGYYISPEFLSLYLALSIYTGALIAETIRAGIQGVDKGMSEAGSSLGLSNGLIMRLIILPLALRIIIPPLASQYMNLVKNTSLGAAVGYSELMMVSSTIMERTGQSVELAVIWIEVYLGLSIVVSLFMNWFNRHMALVER